jgi:shikimate dehydrogenase
MRPRSVWPSPTTSIAGVVGFPVCHSLSPRLHNAAYAAMGLDWCYLAFEVPPGSLERAVAGAAALGLRGLSVTMPHKDAAARVATRHSRQVRRLGAANTLVFDAGIVRAESCDGDGLLDDLRQGGGFDPSGRRCGVIGAGGAGRAAVLALAEAGAAEIVVVNRTAARAWRAVALAPKVAHVGRPEELKGMDLVVQATPVGMPERAGSALEADGSRAGPLGSRSTGRPGRPGGEATATPPASAAGGPSAAELPPERGLLGVFGFRRSPESLPAPESAATPVREPGGPSDAKAPAGPSGTEVPGRPGADQARTRWPELGDGRGKGVVAGVDPSWFGAGQLVVDLVYEPARTVFLRVAEEHGATVRSGLGMLVHQAARQVIFWTGAVPPLEVMWDVAGGAP